MFKLVIFFGCEARIARNSELERWFVPKKLDKIIAHDLIRGSLSMAKA